MLRSLTLFFLLAAAGLAQPAAGQIARDFALNDLQGRTVKLSERLAAGPVVLIVLRGFPGYQCPLCNRQVNDFLRNAAAIDAAGARLIFVYPGPPAGLEGRAREFTVDKQLPPGVDFLLDPGYAFTNLYSLRWDAPRETAYPATFVIRRSGEIAFAKVSKSHAGRATPREILDQLQLLR